jgi:hypothetical protein
MSLSDTILSTLSSLQSKLEEEKEKILDLYRSSIVSMAPSDYTDRYGEIAQKPGTTYPHWDRQPTSAYKIPDHVWYIDFCVGRYIIGRNPVGYDVYGGYFDNYGNLHLIEGASHSRDDNTNCFHPYEMGTCKCPIAYNHDKKSFLKKEYKYPLSDRVIQVVKDILKEFIQPIHHYGILARNVGVSIGVIKVLEKMLPIWAEQDYNQILLLKHANKDKKELAALRATVQSLQAKLQNKDKKELAALRAEVESLRAEVRLLKFAEPVTHPELELLTFSTPTVAVPPSLIVEKLPTLAVAPTLIVEELSTVAVPPSLIVEELPTVAVPPSLVIQELPPLLETKSCKGYFEWTLQRIITYCGYTNLRDQIGTPYHTTIVPISKEYTHWINTNISYCLAKILFQIRHDENPIEHKICHDILTYIRSYSEIQSELKECICDTWSEEDHDNLIRSMTYYADLKLTMWITFSSTECSCKIAADYPIPILFEDDNGTTYEARRWEHRIIKYSTY